MRAVVALTVAAVFLVATAASQSQRGAVRHSLILFIATPGDENRLYVVRPDGTHLRRLAPGVAEIAWPAWSPNGRWIAFSGRATDDPQRELYIVRPNGSGLRRLTSLTGLVTMPAWSPDGHKIAFVRRNPPALMAVRRDGTNLRPVLNGWNPYFPAWSPDGRTIAFEHAYAALSAVAVVDVATGAAHDVGRGCCPTWAPRGSTIAYPDVTSVSIMRTGARSGTPIATARPDRWFTGFAEWSRDGRRLAFFEHSNAEAVLRTVRRSGDAFRAIARWPSQPAGPCFDDFASWSPDARRLAFIRETAQGACRIGVVRSDGTHLRLLRTPGPLVWLHWQPLPRG